MKVISILQPWASLCVHTDENGKALKQIETRSWNTKYRGELLIHASKKQTHMLDTINHLYEWMNNGVYHKWIQRELPFGAIIGKVNLVDVLTSEELQATEEFSDGYRNKWSIQEEINPQEKAFGNYDSGRFGWLLSDPVLFENPIPCKGQLGIWNFDPRSILNSGISHVQFTHDEEPSIEEVLAINAMYEKAKHLKA